MIGECCREGDKRVSTKKDGALAVTGAQQVYRLTMHDLFDLPIGEMTPEERVGAAVVVRALKDRVEAREKDLKAAAKAVAKEVSEGRDKVHASFDGIGEVRVVSSRSARRLDAKKVLELLREYVCDDPEAELAEVGAYTGGTPYEQVRLKGAPSLLMALEGL